MIQLSGLTIKNEENNDGDIEIIFTGLRPGENPYEELPIDADSKKQVIPEFTMQMKNLFLLKLYYCS